VISIGELVPIFQTEGEARAYFDRYRVLRLHVEIAFFAGALDREQIATGQRLGENVTTGLRRFAGIMRSQSSAEMRRSTGCAACEDSPTKP
jgi:hypothetical protein